MVGLSKKSIIAAAKTTILIYFIRFRSKTNTMSAYPVVLSFSHSDPSGATGIQADIQTFASLNCQATSILTAVCVADTRGILQCEPVDGEQVLLQARYLLEDMHVQAFKIGHIGAPETVSVLAEIVADYPDIPLILDPAPQIFQAENGEEAAQMIKELLLPYAHLLICNVLEARWLTDFAGDFLSAGNEDLNPFHLAQELANLGASQMLLTGEISEQRELVNYFFHGGDCVRSDAWQWIAREVRGAGDTLSAASAALLAQGLPLPDAVLEAQSFVWQAIMQGVPAGMGMVLPDRFFWLREMDSEDDNAL